MPEAARAVITLSQAARWFAVLCAAILVVGAVFAALGHGIALIIAAAIAFTPLWIWAFLAFMARGYRRQAQKLLDGESVLGWDFDPETWRAWLDRESRRLPWLWLIMAGPFLLAGVAVAFQLDPEDRAWFGSTAAAVTALGAIGFVFGAIVGATIRLARQGMFRSVRDETGRFRVGPAQLYVTGTFWPLGGGLYSAAGVSLEAGDAPQLVFHINAFRGGTQKVRIPVPPAHLDEARRFVEAAAAARR